MLKQWWKDVKHIPAIDTRWLAVWLLIYADFIVLDVYFPGFWGSSVLKYTGIFLCTIYAYQKYRKDTTLFLALFLTFLSDTILVWTDWELIGVFCFCFAQFVHMIRQTKAKPQIIGLYAITVILFFNFAILQGIKPLYAISTIYALELVCNVVLSIGRYRKNRSDYTARCNMYGFIAFIACDTCVAARYLTLDGLLPVAILPLVSFLVWVFYYPSQVLIANGSDTPPTRKIAKKSAIE